MATGPKAQQVVTDEVPPSKPPAPAPPASRKTVPASPGHKQPHETLRAFVAYYRAELQRISGPPGVNRGGSGPIIAARAEGALMVVEALADWLAEGQPSPAAVLTNEERERWKWAKRNGMPVPAEIEAQL